MAFGDYMDTMSLYQADNPTVCIMSPDPLIEPTFYPYMYDITRSTVWEWETKLEHATDGDWHFPINEYPFDIHNNKHPRDFPECNIFITFDKLSGSSALGTTAFDFSNSNHKYAFITVYTEAYPPQKITITLGSNNNVNLELKAKPLDIIDIRNILLHEFGHGLGLEHYYIYDDNCKKNECGDRSVMYHSLSIWKNTTKTVTNEDIQMVVRIYGEDGFDRHFPRWIPDQCDFVDGIISECR